MLLTYVTQALPIPITIVPNPLTPLITDQLMRAEAITAAGSRVYTVRIGGALLVTLAEVGTLITLTATG